MATLAEKQADLFRGRNWGTVTTLRKDGSPHSTPVWIDTDGESVLSNTAIGRTKERHLRRDPRASVVVLPAEDQQSGSVSVTGTAEITEEGALDHINKLAKSTSARTSTRTSSSQRRGSSTRNVEPRPGTDETLMRPSIRSTSSRHTYSPRPVPLTPRVWCGSRR